MPKLEDLDKLLENIELSIRGIRQHLGLFDLSNNITPNLSNDLTKIKKILTDEATNKQEDLKDLKEESKLSVSEQKPEQESAIDQINDPVPKPTQASKEIIRTNLPKNTIASSLPEDMLGPTPDITDENWPEAIDSDMIVNDDDVVEQQFRALQIVNHIREEVTDKKVLDFGCGSGCTAKEYADLSNLAVGYDVVEHNMWDESDHENLILTTDYDKVVANGPYDLIILFDVIDHIVGEDPSNIMKMVSSLLSDEGTVFIRTHPWTSRTGGHAYKSINKAYLHLILTPNEMAKLGISIEPNLKLSRPMAVYESLFTTYNLKVIDKKAKSSPIESYFNDNLIDRIKKINWCGKIETETAVKIMGNHFVDYKLKHIHQEGEE